MNQNLALLGIALIFIGFIVVVFASFSGTKTEAKAAFIGFVGPFPFGFGTDKKILYFAVALSLFLFISYLIFFFITRSPSN